MDLDSAGSALSLLRERGLILARDTSLFPDEQEYVFAESATQHVAYESLSLKVRTRMHRVVATWLEARTGEGAASLRARHHELAGDLAKAARAYMQAGAHAAELGQNAEALYNGERAAQIDEDTLASATPSTRQTSPITLETSDTRVLAWRERVILRLSLGDVLRRIGDLDDARLRYDEARDRIMRQERRSEETLDESEMRRFDAQVDYRLALLDQLHGDLDGARAHVERAIERGGSATEKAAMWALSAAIASRQNRLDDCREASLRGVAVCRLAEQRDRRWQAAVSELLITLGSVFFRRRQYLRAERCYLQAARAVDERTDPYQVSRALNNVAATRFSRDDAAGAGRVLARVLELSERAGDRAMTMVALSNLSEIEHRLDRAESARDYALAAVRLGEQLEARSDLPDIYKNLASAALALGEHDEAVEAAAQALASAREEAGRVYLPSVAEVVAVVCAGATGAAGRESLQLALVRVLEEDFAGPQLGEAARRCRAILRGRNGALGA
jgi:tetratricopeptide (TPR) repeat protein